MQVPLISNNEIKEIFELSAQAVYRLGSDELPVILSQICEYISVYDTMMVYAFVKDEGPQPLFNNFKIKEIKLKKHGMYVVNAKVVILIK